MLAATLCMCWSLDLWCIRPTGYRPSCYYLGVKEPRNEVWVSAWQLSPHTASALVRFLRLREPQRGYLGKAGPSFAMWRLHGPQGPSARGALHKWQDCCQPHKKHTRPLDFVAWGAITGSRGAQGSRGQAWRGPWGRPALGKGPRRRPHTVRAF